MLALFVYKLKSLFCSPLTPRRNMHFKLWASQASVFEVLLQKVLLYESKSFRRHFQCRSSIGMSFSLWANKWHQGAKLTTCESSLRGVKHKEGIISYILYRFRQEGLPYSSLSCKLCVCWRQGLQCWWQKWPGHKKGWKDSEVELTNYFIFSLLVFCFQQTTLCNTNLSSRAAHRFC